MPPVHPTIVAQAGGLVIAEDGARVIVVDRGTGPWATAAFVLAVLAVVFGGFGAVTLALGATSEAAVPPWLGTTGLLIGLACAVAVLAVVRRIRAARSRPVGDLRPVVVLDRARRIMTDGDGAVLAPLEHVRFERRMRMTSSSPALVAVTPRGTWILKRGNPFDGGLGDLDAVLTAVARSVGGS